ncbi:MAG: tetratricopeptide repeat protein [Candidatus Eisenbacteria bacterium]|nr:tetratricopeptide repeat protein [Candidatus Eisenbacteria bacterium]
MSGKGSGLPAAIADRYLIEREIGRGGMAVVYLANDRKHGRPVAIKLMAPHVAAAVGSAQFLREIEIAARLNHPHILPLFDSGISEAAPGEIGSGRSGQTAERLFYVMPYITGESLRARLQREGQLSLAEALRLTREIGGALHHAHTQGLVHRDVKPENVLLSDGIPLVADFGIAIPRGGAFSGNELDTTIAAGEPLHSAESDATQFHLGDQPSGSGGEIAGTPHYMAPEQAAGRTDLDGRADQYALGCILYELLGGRPPFRGQSVIELLDHHRRSTPPEIATLRPDVPDDVARALHRSLAKEPSERFPTMTQFIEALNAAAIRAYASASREGEGAGIPNNLPIASTSFIGREKEMDEVRALLADARLLTLAGSGGTGKTRLAQQLATEQIELFPGGAWFVEFAPLADPTLVPKATASALAVREDSNQSLTDGIIAAIGTRAVLLVLDNCEHVIETAASLVHRLLSACPNLRVVATSREPLGLNGEVSYRVPSLALPPADPQVTPEQVSLSPAARLFIERARAGKSDFTVTPENARALASICRRLDGVPLAIELAAARIRALPVEQIEARLDSRFRLLTGGSRTALPRQQTLRALIDWSYDLLKEAERELLLRLSVFIGGWTLETAEAVTAGEGVDDWEVLDLLSSLVDKSLVVYDEQAAGPRYRLLETVRQYARDRLLESGRAEAWRDRHLDHFLAWAEANMAALVGRDQQSWLDQYEIEHDNFRTALDWADGEPLRVQKGLQLVGALQGFWLAHGHYAEGRARYDHLLAADPRLDAGARARALNGAANLAFSQSDYRAARPLHQESLDLRRAQGDKNGVATSLNNLASILFFEGHLEEATRLIEESLELRREIGDTKGVGSCLNNLAMLADKRGDLKTAREYLAESLTLRRQVGDLTGIAASLHNLGVITMRQGDLDAAEALWQEAQAIRTQLGDRTGIATTHHTLGAVATERRNFAVAQRHFQEEFRLSIELGSGLITATALEGFATLALLLGARRTATHLWAAADRLRAEIGAPSPEVDAAARERDYAQARAAMGTEAFDRAWAEGRALPPAEIVNELRDLDPKE